MERLPRFRQLVGYRHDRVGEASNDFPRLQELFAGTIPDSVRAFLTALADCVLYYRFDVPTASGKAKGISHFVTTNIGPELDWGISPFPASLIGKIVQYRGSGLPAEYLPLMMDFGKSAWVWCRLGVEGGAVVVPKGSREFGTAEREWKVIAPSFDAFVAGMRLDISPFLQAFRIGGTGNVQPSLRAWFVGVLGDDWEARVEEMLKRKRGRPSEPSS